MDLPFYDIFSYKKFLFFNISNEAIVRAPIKNPGYAYG